MIKLILSGILAAAIIYIGIGIKRYYRQRSAIIKDIISFIERMSQEISFLKPPISQIVDNYCHGNKKEFSKVLHSAMNGGNVNCLYLHEDERTLLVSMLDNVTKLDCRTLLNNLEGYRMRFISISAIAHDKSEKLGQLSFKLSVMMAILTMILLA